MTDHYLDHMLEFEASKHENNMCRTRKELRVLSRWKQRVLSWKLANSPKSMYCLTQVEVTLKSSLNSQQFVGKEGVVKQMGDPTF